MRNPSFSSLLQGSRITSASISPSMFSVCNRLMRTSSDLSALFSRISAKPNCHSPIPTIILHRFSHPAYSFSPFTIDAHLDNTVSKIQRLLFPHSTQPLVPPRITFDPK
ncbi:hypothetical protein FRC03_005747 [Tulasnella sp. 419]|nr:hypothetical protein FRC03_005747 [Tulasnella sp. 419]